MGLYSCIVCNVEVVEVLVWVGNFYVNCSMIGVIVGSQLFGGEGLFGIGLKVGGLYYLYCFMVEWVMLIDMISVGGNVMLLLFDDVGL